MQLKRKLTLKNINKGSLYFVLCYPEFNKNAIYKATDFFAKASGNSK